MNSFLKRWLSDSAAPGTAARPRKLGVEHLEDRVTPATTIPDLPVAQGPVQNGGAFTVDQATFGGETTAVSPDLQQNPLRPDQLVAAFSTGTGIGFTVSNNRGVDWGREFSGISQGSLGSDPLNNNGFGQYTIADAPAIAFNRQNEFYLVHIQRNAANTSGRVVVDKYAISAGGSITNLNQRSTLYRWVNQDAAYYPAIGVNTEVATFTDPDTGAVQENPNTERGVYVAWSTNATQAASGPAGWQVRTSAVFMAVSDDGGASYSTPVPVNGAGEALPFRPDEAIIPSSGFNAAQAAIDPRITFTQSKAGSTAGTAGSTPGGNLAVTYNTGGAVAIDVTDPFAGRNPTNPLTVQQTVQNNGGVIAGAITPTGGVLTEQVTDFTQAVTITEPGFDFLNDLNVTLSVYSQDMGRIRIELIAPNGLPSIVLLNSRQVVDGAGSTVDRFANVGGIYTNMAGNSLAQGARPGLPGGNPSSIGLTRSGTDILNDYGLVFDQEAARYVNDAANVAPYIISVRPEDFTRDGNGRMGLAKYRGATAAQLSGTWTLRVTNYKANDTGTPPPPPARVTRWDMKFVSRVDNTAFGQGPPGAVGIDLPTSAATAATSPTTTGTATAALPTVGVQGWYSVAVDSTDGSFSQYQGRMYLAFTGGGGNNTDVFVISSDTNGASWSTPVKVNDDTLSDSFSGGNRAQFQPTVAVDPTTGTVVVMWYDARWDASNARPATFIATSVDGGRTFSPNTFLNFTKSALDAIDRSTVAIEPVPNNLATTPYFGNRQGLVAFDGTVVPLWTGNINSGGAGASVLQSALTAAAAGPRVIQGDMGPVIDDFVSAGPVPTTYNNVFSVDGTRQLNAFYVRFDRWVDANTFTPADVQLRYRATDGSPAEDISAAVTSVTPLPPNQDVRTFQVTGAPADFGFAESTITVPAPLGADVIENIRVRISLNGSGLASDLAVFLTAPNGDFIQLAGGTGGGASVPAAYGNTQFDDTAPLIGSGNPPYTFVAPLESLTAAFNGLAATGDWVLEVFAFGEVIQINNWSLELTSPGAGVTRFLVNLEPQSRVGTYSYSVGPNISDRIRQGAQTGNLMDQNANGVSGEAQDAFANPTSTTGTPFTLPYTVESLPLIIPGPRVVSVTPGLNRDQAATFLDVTFSQDILGSSFTPAQVLALVTPIGTRITSGFTITANPPGTPIALANRTFRIGFPPQAVSGYYALQLSPDIRSATGLKMDPNTNAGVELVTGRVIDPLVASTVSQQYNTGAVNVTVPVAANVSTPSEATSTFQVTDEFFLTQQLTTPIQVRLNIAVADTRDLTAQLIAPDGTVIQLFSNPGKALPPFANFTNTVLTDFAPDVNAIANQGAPFTGTFLPQQQLSVLNGKFSAGNWTLRVTNRSTTAAATILSWGLSLPQPVLGGGLGEPIADNTTVGFRVFTTNPNNVTATNTWTPLGPTLNTDLGTFEQVNGAITVTAVDPTDPSGNTVYAGAANGGLWKTTNFLTLDPAGPVWIPLLDAASARALRVSSIAIIPSNNNSDQSSIVIVGTGDADTRTGGVGFLRSTDGGNTFRLLDSTVNADATTAILPIDSPLRDNIFSANNSYVYKVVVDPVRQPTGEFYVYAAVGGDAAVAGLWRSANSGRNWQRLRAGEATDVVLAPNRVDVTVVGGQNVSTLRNADVAYAAFAGAGGGVFFAQNITAPGTVTLNLLTGGAGKPLFSNGTTNISVGNAGTNPNANPTRILLTAVQASANTDPLAVRIYQGWLYALVIGGGAPGLYVTKDFGANWTLVRLGTTGGVWNGRGTANLTNDETLPAFDYGLPPPVDLPVFNALAADPTDPNVVYLAGDNRRTTANGGFPVGTGGVYRVDISTMNDPHAQVGGDNSAGGVGPQSEGASTGGLAGGPSRVVINPFTGLPLNNSAFFNRMRDPNNPFTSGSTQIIAGSQFVNNGFNAQISLYSGLSGNDQTRNIETTFDPLTRKTRLLVSTSFGVFSAVDAANPLPTQGVYANAQSLTQAGQRVSVNGTTFDSIGTAVSVSGNRSSNLALAAVTQTALQPSELAADVAGLYNRITRDASGTPLPADRQNSRGNQWIYSVTDQAYLNANGDILRSASGNYGQDRSNGEVNITSYLQYPGTIVAGEYAGPIESWVYTGKVETDPQGSGTIYQYRPAPFALTAGAPGVNPQGDSTDIFSVTLPGAAPIGRSNGLFNIGLGNTVTTGIWASTNPVEFAVNTADASGIVIGSPLGGRVFLTTDQGVNWFDINGTQGFNGSQAVALAFGGRIATPPGQPPSGANDFIYNGTAEGRIWVTLNGGGTWTDISAGLSGGPIQKIIPNPRGNTFEAYAITERGVFYKADARTAAAWQNITGNLLSLTRPVFGEATVTPLLSELEALAVDWRYDQPRLYVGGDSGVYRSVDRGGTWTLYPSLATNPGAVDGGYLPTVRVTDLDLVYGNLNPSGVPDQTSARNVLVASTYGRGLFAIRLDPATVPGGDGTLGTSGPWVNTAPLTPPAAATGAASITLNFGNGSSPVKVDPTTLNPTNLLIVAPNGSFVPYTVTDVSGLAANGLDSLANAFRLNFTPTQTGTYQLLVSTGVRDTSGRQMNQDRDVTNGEIPQDWFTTTYAITVNQAPTITPVANVGLPINTASGALPFTVGDAETPAGTLTVAAVSSNQTLLPNANVVLGGAGANRTVTVTPAAGQTGTATVTLTVTDAGGRQTSTTFTVSVAVAAIPFVDNFNRPDAPNLGGQWTIQAGTAEVSLNAALATSTPLLATLTNVSQLNSTAQATVSLPASGANGSSGLVARFSGTGAAPTNYLGAVVQQNGVVTARILRQVNGVTTTLSTSAPLTFAPQYVLRFDVVNDALKLFVNGTLATFAYDTALTAAGGTGVRFTTGNRLDDYSADNVALLPVTLPAVPGTTVTDTFTQANGTQLSRSWQDRFGNLSVTGNAAVGQAATNLSTYNIPPTANAGAQANVAFTAANQTVGVVLRYSGTAAAPLSNFYWAALTNLGNGQLYAAVYKFNASGAASLLGAANALGSGGALRFEANGGSLKLFLNGTLLVSAVDGAPLAAGVAGLLSARGGSADDFTAFALGTTTTLPFSDTFDAGNFGNQLGSVWTQRAGAFDLSGNTARATGPAGNTATLNGVNAADVVVTGTFKTPSNLESGTGLIARYSGVGETNFYWAALNPFGNGVPGYSAQIWKVVNGVGTLLNANAFPLSATSNPSTTNMVLRFEVVGASLKLFLNDQLASYATDTSLTTGSVGVRSVAGSQLDDFSAAVLTPTSPTLPFNDAFANNPPRNTLSSDWQERSGYFSLAGGAATGNETTQGNLATLNGVNAADVVVTGTFKTPSNLEAATGLIARYTGTNGTGDNNFYWAALNPFGNGVPGYSAQIWKVVNGVATVLNANSFPLSAGTNPSTTDAVLRFEVVGASLKLFLNDQLVSFAYDTALTSGSVGIRTAGGGSVAAFAAAVRPTTPPGLPFTDAFTAGLNPQNTLSTNWQERSGYFSVASDRAVGGAAGQANVATVNGVNAADVTISADFLFTGANQSAQLVGRYQGNASGTGDANMYVAAVNTLANGDALLRIMVNVNGAVSVLATATLTGYFSGGFNTPVNDVQLQIVGNQLTMTFGATTLLATNSTFASGSVGIRTTVGAAVDDFDATSP